MHLKYPHLFFYLRELRLELMLFNQKIKQKELSLQKKEHIIVKKSFEIFGFYLYLFNRRMTLFTWNISN
jgi:hypothetical protein